MGQAVFREAAEPLECWVNEDIGWCWYMDMEMRLGVVVVELQCGPGMM